jgi:hypothetical protein
VEHPAAEATIASSQAATTPALIPVDFRTRSEYLTSD